MTWYRTGTITLTSGSATVTGEGTLWVTRAKPGEALYTTDGKLYEVLNVTSDTEMQLTQPYTGAGGAGVPYVLVPTRSIERVLAGQVAELVNLYSTLPETATNAQAAAQAAAASAIEAEERADAAGESASSADADRVAAQAAAVAADASATFAGGRAIAAEGSAASAADSATLAGTRATAAGTSAAAADDARVLAQAAASSASNKEPLIAAGLASQYWRGDKTWRDLFTDVRAATLTGLSLATSSAVTAADTVLAAIGKVQAQVSLRAPLASPVFTGNPESTGTAPGAADNSTRLATTSWVRSAMSNIAIAAGFAFYAGAPAYLRLPSWLGGWLIQWSTSVGTTDGGGLLSFGFAIAFPNAKMLQLCCNGDGGFNGFMSIHESGGWGTSPTGIAVKVYGAGGAASAGTAHRANWIAIGY